MVHNVSEKYPKTMWEEKFEQAAKEITSDPDFSMPLSDWVSEKYSGLQYEIIEVREIPEQETTIRFMLESPLRERISKGFSVFFKVSYSNRNAPILNRRTVNEVLCKVEVYRLIHLADDINILVDRDSLKIIETKFAK